MIKSSKSSYPTLQFVQDIFFSSKLIPRGSHEN
jgi:hypothetical protein